MLLVLFNPEAAIIIYYIISVVYCRNACIPIFHTPNDICRFFPPPPLLHLLLLILLRIHRRHFIVYNISFVTWTACICVISGILAEKLTTYTRTHRVLLYCLRLLCTYAPRRAVTVVSSPLEWSYYAYLVYMGLIVPIHLYGILDKWVDCGRRAKEVIQNDRRIKKFVCVHLRYNCILTQCIHIRYARECVFDYPSIYTSYKNLTRTLGRLRI